MLKRRWQVSIAALIRAAQRLERLDDDRYQSLFRQMSARGQRLREKAVIGPPSEPRGSRAMAEVLYGQILSAAGRPQALDARVRRGCAGPPRHGGGAARPALPTDATVVSLERHRPGTR